MAAQHLVYRSEKTASTVNLICLSILHLISGAQQLSTSNFRFYPNATLQVTRADLLDTCATSINLLELSVNEKPADAYTPLQSPDWYALPLALGGWNSGEHSSDNDEFERSSAPFATDAYSNSTTDSSAHALSRCSTTSDEVIYSIQGLNSVDQRLANNGRQFNREPPDQALCCGSGFLVEGVNSVLRVRNAETGKPLTGPVALNSFFGYTPEVAVVGNSTVYGQYITDPTCLYDATTQRFFFVVVSSPVNASLGSLLPGSTIDIAVSKTSSPTGNWHIYRIPAQNDGGNGTPNHSIPPGPAIADYPKISTNEDGLFISTVEGALATGRFVGVNIYAINKWNLAAGSEQVDVVNFFIHGTQPPHPYALIPAHIPADAANTNNPAHIWADALNSSEAQQSDTEFFVSTQQLLENGRNIAETIQNVSLWSVRNTHSLNGTKSTTPGLWVEVVIIPTPIYNNTLVLGVPQKNGTNPLGMSLQPPQPVGAIASNEAYIVNAFYADRNIWGAFMSAVVIDNQNSTAAIIFQIDPVNQTYKELGVLSLPGQHLLFPTVAVNSKGQGAVISTLVGPDYYLSAAYAKICKDGVGSVEVAKLVQAAQDGFKQYSQFKFRKRWGDYGGAAVSEQGDLFLATEYIGSGACDVEEFETADTITRCNGTRTSLTNWASNIMRLQP